MSSGHIAVITARRADENRGRCVGRPPPAPGAAPDRAGLMNLPVDLRDWNSVVIPYFCVLVNLPARCRCGTSSRLNAERQRAQCCVWDRSVRVPLWKDVCRRRVTVERLFRKYMTSWGGTPHRGRIARVLKADWTCIDSERPVFKFRTHRFAWVVITCIAKKSG